MGASSAAATMGVAFRCRYTGGVASTMGVAFRYDEDYHAPPHYSTTTSSAHRAERRRERRRECRWERRRERRREAALYKRVRLSSAADEAPAGSDLPLAWVSGIEGAEPNVVARQQHRDGGDENIAGNYYALLETEVEDEASAGSDLPPAWASGIEGAEPNVVARQQHRDGGDDAGNHYALLETEVADEMVGPNLKDLIIRPNSLTRPKQRGSRRCSRNNIRISRRSWRRKLRRSRSYAIHGSDSRTCSVSLTSSAHYKGVRLSSAADEAPARSDLPLVWASGIEDGKCTTLTDGSGSFKTMAACVADKSCEAPPPPPPPPPPPIYPWDACQDYNRHRCGRCDSCEVAERANQLGLLEIQLDSPKDPTLLLVAPNAETCRAWCAGFAGRGRAWLEMSPAEYRHAHAEIALFVPPARLPHPKTVGGGAGQGLLQSTMIGYDYDGRSIGRSVGIAGWGSMVVTDGSAANLHESLTRCCLSCGKQVSIISERGVKGYGGCERGVKGLAQRNAATLEWSCDVCCRDFHGMFADTGFPHYSGLDRPQINTCIRTGNIAHRMLIHPKTVYACGSNDCDWFACVQCFMRGWPGPQPARQQQLGLVGGDQAGGARQQTGGHGGRVRSGQQRQQRHVDGEDEDEEDLMGDQIWAQSDPAQFSAGVDDMFADLFGADPSATIAANAAEMRAAGFDPHATMSQMGQDVRAPPAGLHHDMVYTEGPQDLAQRKRFTAAEKRAKACCRQLGRVATELRLVEEGGAAADAYARANELMGRDEWVLAEALLRECTRCPHCQRGRSTGHVCAGSTAPQGLSKIEQLRWRKANPGSRDD